MEGETQALTQSDSSRSWDINLVCHSAVSRRRPRALEQMAAVPRSGHSLGILLPRLPEQLGRAGGHAGHVAPAATLSVGLWLPGALPVSPLTGRDDAESPGVSSALDPVYGITWMETIRLIPAHTDEHRGKEMDSRGLSGCGTATGLCGCIGG